MTTTKRLIVKGIELVFSFTILTLICIFILAMVSTIKTAITLFIPSASLILVGFIRDIKNYRLGEKELYSTLSAVFACSFLFWPSLLTAIFTNIFTIILFSICFLFIIKLYVIFSSDKSLF